MSEAAPEGRFIDPRERGPKEFTGNLLISKEELQKAVDADPFLNQILEYVEQDRGYIQAIRSEIAKLNRVIRGLRNRVQDAKARIDSRRRQHKHFTKLLRKRLAWERIRETRKQLGFN